MPALKLSALLQKGLVICSWKIYLRSQISYWDLIMNTPSVHVGAYVYLFRDLMPIKAGTLYIFMHLDSGS